MISNRTLERLSVKASLDVLDYIETVYGDKIAEWMKALKSLKALQACSLLRFFLLRPSPEATSWSLVGRARPGALYANLRFCDRTSWALGLLRIIRNRNCSAGFQLSLSASTCISNWVEVHAMFSACFYLRTQAE